MSVAVLYNTEGLQHHLVYFSRATLRGSIILHTVNILHYLQVNRVPALQSVEGLQDLFVL